MALALALLLSVDLTRTASSHLRRLPFGPRRVFSTCGGSYEHEEALRRDQLAPSALAVEIAFLSGDTSAEHNATCAALGREVYAMLTRLCR